MNRWSVILALGACQAAAAGSYRIEAHDLEPIILMQGQAIVACGVKAKFGQLTESFVMEMSLKKEGDGKRLDMKLSGPEQIRAFDLQTKPGSHDPFVGTKPVISDRDAYLTIDATKMDLTGYMRDFFVEDQLLTVEMAGGLTLELAIRGPISNSVRAAYLNCAGDFYR
jgi:hypothetical protein